MRAKQKLSATDAAWLRMDVPSNRMVVHALLTFHEPLEIERVRALLETRLLTYERFRMRVVKPRRWRAAFWEPDPRFDLACHLRPVQLVPPADREVLRQLTGSLMAQPLDFSRPPWEVLFIDGFRGGTVLLVRLHHCIADGMALLRVLISLTDGEPHTLEQPRAGAKPRPSSLPARLARGALLAVRGAAALAKLLLLPKDHPTPLKGPLSGEKSAAWSAAIPVARLKAIGHAAGATVNDVLVAALTGALRQVLPARRIPRGIRAVLPVDLRPGRPVGELGNFFGLVFLKLPVDLAEPGARLREVMRRMGALKRSAQSLVALQILRIVGRFVHPVARLVIWMFGRKATLVLTNVPGPHGPRSLAGESIAELTFWVPQSGGLGIGVSLMSYDGQARIAIAADRALLPGPQAVIDGIDHELLLLTLDSMPAVARFENPLTFEGPLA